MTIRTAPATTTVEVQQSSPRPTPAPATRRFRDMLDASGGALLSGVEAAASLVPGGGSIVAASVRGGSAHAPAPGAGERAEGPGGAPAPEGGHGNEAGSMEQMLASSQDQNLYYLQLQEQMSAENRRYTALSNVLKARHETAKAAIGNIR